MKRKACGVGICDIGMKDANGERLKSYLSWANILQRSYDPKYHAKQPTYINCEVCEDWKVFSNYKKFYDANYIEGHHLDKDLLQQGVENKVYSPETCLFIPSQLNSFLANKYSNNTSEFVGVSYHKRNKKWAANISIYNHETGKRKLKHLGYFDNREEASLAYAKARELQADIWRVVMKTQFGWSSDLINLIK